MVLRLVLALLVFAAATGCVRERPDLEKFVAEYVRSAYEGTDLYRRYTPPEKRDVVEEDRLAITGDFKFIGFEDYGAGFFEYVVEFSNGVTAAIRIHEREGDVEMASLSIRRM